MHRVLKDRSFTRTLVLLCYPGLCILCPYIYQKRNMEDSVHITNLREVRKQNSKQAIEMVLMDQTGTNISVTLWQELFAEFRHTLHCGSSYLIQNLRIVDNQSKYRVTQFHFWFISPELHLSRRSSIQKFLLIFSYNKQFRIHFSVGLTFVLGGHFGQDIVGVIADLIDVKTINPPHRMTVKLRDNSNSDIIMTLHHVIDKNLLLQEPLIVMLSLGKIKDATDKYPLSVQNIKYGTRLYVNTDIAEIQQFCDSLCVPFYSGGIIDDRGGSQSQSSQSNLVEKFLHNAQVDCYYLTVGTVDEIIIDAPWSYDSCPYCTTTFDPSKVGSACRSCQNRMNDTVPRYKLNVRMEHNGNKGNFIFWDATCIKMFGKTVAKCRDELIAAGDDIKVFPSCVDEILSKTWAIRFKYHSQLRQSCVLDASEEPYHIQTLTTTLGLKD
ncbi:hypothetical protein HKD37_03G007462 [Glycine soja]